jgi:diguanylate cyclase (GGDEF)-like protein
MDPQAADDRRSLEVLNEVARIATMDLELRPMLQRVTDALARKFGWEFVALVSIDRDRRMFVCDALTTMAETSVYVGYSRPLGSGVVGEVAASGRTILVDDVTTSRNYIETMPGARSELCVPVKHHRGIVAVLNLESKRPAAFREQKELLETVADQIAGAIANAQMYAELQIKTRALEEANTHLAHAIETLHRISTIDGLTGVANRRHFDETLALEWRRAARTQAPLSLLLLDIDFFKAFNDSVGHLAGDECLRRVAQALREGVHRAGDLVARYGGEEFAVLLPETGPQHAQQVALMLRDLIASMKIAHAASPLGGRVTMSIGVASTVPPRDQHTIPEDFLRDADAALYEAKRQGRDRVVSAPPR